MTAPLSWGRKVSVPFRDRVRTIAANLRIVDPSWLMACFAWETGRTFSPSIRNAAGSGAVGLIQFMPQTAALLHTSSSALARMTAEGQLDYVERYFAPAKGRLRNLGDVYCQIIWPGAVGKSDDAIIFSKALKPTAYLQNRGLDINLDGDVRRGEMTAKVQALYTEGLRPENAA